IRQIVLKRDKYERQHCKENGKVTKQHTVNELDMEHIKPLETHPHLAYELDNLMTLCVNCHNIKEKRHWKQKEKKWNDEQWDKKSSSAAVTAKSMTNTKVKGDVDN